MLDVIGAAFLTAFFGICTAILIGSTLLAARSRLGLGALALSWFAAIGVLAAAGLFSAAGTGALAIGVAVVAPIALWLWSARWSRPVRAIALGTPLSALVALHAGRVFGVFFLLLFAAERLPPTFAWTAGLGDIAVAVTALPLAWMIHRRARAWRALTLAWNAFAFLDLLTAVALGVASAPDTPARFIFETPSTAAMSSLPWVLVPGVMVPMYVLTHVAIFAQLARHRTRVPGLPSAYFGSRSGMSAST